VDFAEDGKSSEMIARNSLSGSGRELVLPWET